jgi:hypothetical protein
MELENKKKVKNNKNKWFYIKGSIYKWKK